MLDRPQLAEAVWKRPLVFIDWKFGFNAAEFLGE